MGCHNLELSLWFNFLLFGILRLRFNVFKASSEHSFELRVCWSALLQQCRWKTYIWKIAWYNRILVLKIAKQLCFIVKLTKWNYTVPYKSEVIIILFRTNTLGKNTILSGSVPLNVPFREHVSKGGLPVHSVVTVHPAVTPEDGAYICDTINEVKQ